MNVFYTRHQCGKWFSFRMVGNCVIVCGLFFGGPNIGILGVVDFLFNSILFYYSILYYLFFILYFLQSYYFLDSIFPRFCANFLPLEVVGIGGIEEVIVFKFFNLLCFLRFCSKLNKIFSTIDIRQTIITLFFEIIL